MKCVFRKYICKSELHFIQERCDYEQTNCVLSQICRCRGGCRRTCICCSALSYKQKAYPPQGRRKGYAYGRQYYGRPLIKRTKRTPHSLVREMRRFAVYISFCKSAAAKPCLRKQPCYRRDNSTHCHTQNRREQERRQRPFSASLFAYSQQ